MLAHRKFLECFIGEMLGHLPYQVVKDAAIQAQLLGQCGVAEELRPAVAVIADRLMLSILPSDYEFCGDPPLQHVRTAVPAADSDTPRPPPA